MKTRTTDYSIFKKIKGNREIDPPNLRKIINSIKIKNMLEMRPILVNKDMEIIDGQHRVEAAKILNVPIYYEIVKDSKPEDVIILNNAQKRWTAVDFFLFWARQGREPYASQLQFIESENIPLREFMLFITAGGEEISKIKEGIWKNAKEEFEIKKYLMFTESTLQFINQKTFGVKRYLTSRAIRRGLISIFNCRGFEENVFFKKLEHGISKLHPCTTRVEYFKMFIEIYNYRNNDPISTKIEGEGGD